jgi:hypothetical protein
VKEEGGYNITNEQASQQSNQVNIRFGEWKQDHQVVGDNCSNGGTS